MLLFCGQKQGSLTGSQLEQETKTKKSGQAMGNTKADRQAEEGWTSKAECATDNLVEDNA